PPLRVLPRLVRLWLDSFRRAERGGRQVRQVRAQAVHEDQRAAAALDRLDVASREPPIDLAPALNRHATGSWNRSCNHVKEGRTAFESALLNVRHAHRNVPLYTEPLLAVAGHL